MRALRRTVWSSLGICLLSLVLYIGYSVAVAIATAWSEAIAAIGTALLVCFTALLISFFLAMVFLTSPIECALLMLRFIRSING